MSSKLDAVRKFDALGLLFLVAFAALAGAAGYAALHFGWFSSPWHLAVWLVVCVAFLVVGLPGQTAPQSTVARSKWAKRTDIENSSIGEKPSIKAFTSAVSSIELAQSVCAIRASSI
jgi:hypothetical protein